MVHPTRVLKIAKEKSQQLLSHESHRFTYKIEKLLNVYQGYSQLKPKIFPKRMDTMFPTTVLVNSEDQPRSHFHHTFGTASSIKRHQCEWAEKYGRAPLRSDVGWDGKATSVKVGPTRDLLPTANGTKKRTFGMMMRTKRSPHKLPGKMVVLQSSELPSNNGTGILCSSVLLTYREGLFFGERTPAAREEENCSSA